MIRDHFRVLKVDLSTGKGRIEEIDGRNTCAGGSGLSALLFGQMGFPDRTWEDPEQPLIFAIGPLTGYFPLMSKVVCAFKSPYHDQFAESHGGGRSALSLRFADLDALVITGKARRPSCLVVGCASSSARRCWLRDAGCSGNRAAAGKSLPASRPAVSACAGRGGPSG